MIAVLSGTSPTIAVCKLSLIQSTAVEGAPLSISDEAAMTSSCFCKEEDSTDRVVDDTSVNDDARWCIQALGR